MDSTSKNKTGPKSVWSPSLGDCIKMGRSCPRAVHNLLKEKWIKLFLNLIATDTQFSVMAFNMLQRYIQSRNR